ncbi:hypothetical protein [Sediminibacterium sp. TEGAF015]|uniref:hypothetical protein n=1 Tax=Sediminibacterium sp. TEGAF015 TaxID=575378 RepID=UPI00222FA352|nr:hypothetical protein [Sediminibacterium sp. TEGAF015]
MPIRIIEIDGLKLTHFEIRLYGLNKIIEWGANKVVFADSDDEFSINRTLLTFKYLDSYPIVCNDLVTMNNDGVVINENYWDIRLGEIFEFSSSFIKDKNIIGFGNSGINKDKLIEILQVLGNSKEGFDWLFFSSYKDDFKALFFSKAKTFYRQHDRNLLGANQLSVLSLKKKIELKITHYEKLLLLKKDLELLNALDKYRSILKKSNNFFEKKVKQINSSNTNYFWFEETNLLL